FSACDQAGCSAANVGAGASMAESFDVKAGAEQVASQKILLPRFLDCPLQNLRAFGKFAPDIDVSGPGIEGEAGDEHALEQLMRVLVDNVAVLERPRFRFVGVTDQVDRFLFVLLDESPFDPARKSGPAAAAQS